MSGYKRYFHNKRPVANNRVNDNLITDGQVEGQIETTILDKPDSKNQKFVKTR